VEEVLRRPDNRRRPANDGPQELVEAHNTFERYRLLTSKEVAAMLGISPTRLCVWRGDGQGPAWVKVGRLVRYRLHDVQAWIAGQISVPVERYRRRA
jgi:predicted DNA-binding transcriptional regulator AlpA